MAGGPERAGQGDVLEEGDAAVEGGFADNLGDAVCAGDDDAREGGLGGVVADADGEVRGVGDDDVGALGGLDGVRAVEDFVAELALDRKSVV